MEVIYLRIGKARADRRVRLRRMNYLVELFILNWRLLTPFIVHVMIITRERFVNQGDLFLLLIGKSNRMNRIGVDPENPKAKNGKPSPARRFFPLSGE